MSVLWAHWDLTYGCMLYRKPVFIPVSPLGPPVIRVPPKDLVLNISQKAQLRCQAEADPPNMTYVWQKEGENIYHIQWVLAQDATAISLRCLARAFFDLHELMSRRFYFTANMSVSVSQPFEQASLSWKLMYL